MSATPGTMTPLPPLSTRTSFTRVDTDYEETQSALDALAALTAAVGEHSERIPSTMSAPEEQHDPQTTITFLLVTGKRRTMSFDPTASVARVKELVWNSWPQDWQDERPTTPSYLRVLYLGRLLQDEETLDSLNHPDPTQPLIVHLSVRPQVERESSFLKRGFSHGSGADADASAGPCCCIIC